MTTVAANKEQGELALAKLKEMFSAYGSDGMELKFSEYWEDEHNRPYCEIEWLNGPFDWALISPKDGGEADGMEFGPVADWPSHMWTEPRDMYAVRVWVDI